MAFKKTNRKAQAAIEFLMTYGWMLLVVLIVGALIFSFVDFGSLLPNQITLNNQLQGDSSVMLARSSDGRVSVLFTYAGARATQINVSNIEVVSVISGHTCNNAGNLNLTNIDVNSANSITKGGTPDTLAFTNGQTGRVDMNCGNLISGDVFEASVKIPYTDARTGITQESSGSIRINVQ